MAEHTTSFDSLAEANLNHAWAASIAETLCLLEVGSVFLSPGSRSGPLSSCLHAHPKLDCHVVIDERSAAFQALGAARATLRPSVLVCTSGTASANYFPAIAEASMAGIPLLVITADRPAEQRLGRSGQTIDQIKLYGSLVRSFTELPLPEDSDMLHSYLLTVLREAVSTSLGPIPGPVHLNQPLRDPLAPLKDSLWSLKSTHAWLAACQSVLPVDACQSVTPAGRELEHLRYAAERDACGLFLVGPQGARMSPADAEALLAVSEALGWPILDGGLSPLRSFASSQLIAHYESLLAHSRDFSAFEPDVVVQLGDFPPGRALRQWLSKLDPDLYTWNPWPASRDAFHQDACALTGPIAGLLDVFKGIERKPCAWERSWRQWAEGSAAALKTVVEEDTESCSPERVACELGRVLPEGARLFLSNSLPIRYYEALAPAGSAPAFVDANRGSNGIDGVLSTALGIALATREPVFVLVGDIALLHDLNLFSAQIPADVDLSVILFNNGGGGIFEVLPIHAYEPAHSEVFRTARPVQYAALAELFAVKYERLEEDGQLERWCGQASGGGLRLLELFSEAAEDRDRLQALHAKVQEQAFAQG